MRKDVLNAEFVAFFEENIVSKPPDLDGVKGS